MFKAKVRLKSRSKVSFSRQVFTPKMDNETHEEHEKRTWKEKVHTDGSGYVIIPKEMFKKSLDGAGTRLGKIKGKGNATYTKHFLGGVQVMSDINTGIKLEDIKHELISGSSDGTRGGSRRVTKMFPYINEWEGELDIIVSDDQIDFEAFKKAMHIAGLNIGVGSFRPANGGSNGMFSVENIESNHFDSPDEVWKSM